MQDAGIGIAFAKSTGLVSLNVHEALHFEGSPICLHPDLFLQARVGAAYTGTGSGSQAASGSAIAAQDLIRVQTNVSFDDTGTATSTCYTAGTTGTVASGGSGTGSEVNTWSGATATSSSTGITVQRGTGGTGILDDGTTGMSGKPVGGKPKPFCVVVADSTNGYGHHSGSAERPPPASCLPINSGGSTGSYSNRPLLVGDLLEIRVWDTLPKMVSAKARPHAERNQHQTSLSIGASPNKPPLSSMVLLPNRITVEPSTTTTRLPSATLAKPPLLYRSTTGQIQVDKSTSLATPPAPESPFPVSLPHQQVRDLSDMTTETISAPPVPSPMPAASISHAFNESKLLPPRLNSDHLFPSPSEDTEDVDDTCLHKDGAGDQDNVWMSRMLQTHQLRLSFVVSVTPQTLTSLKKGSTRTQVSLLRQVADLYHLSTFDMVSIHRFVSSDEIKAALQTVSVDFLLVTIKDQFISRGDMHFFQKSLVGKWIYEGERLHDPTRGVHANAREIRHVQQRALLSGIITDATKITFRSRSSRIIWLVQMSSEMWDYASPYELHQQRDQSNNDVSSPDEECVCQLYFEKWITFIHKLFAKWKELEATHSLTVVFFSRSFRSTLSSTIDTDDSVQYDMYGRQFDDHFGVVLESETGPDWEALVVKIKEAFVKYPYEMGWAASTHDGDGGGDGDDSSCWPSTANQGNVLEAINVTLNMLQFHYLDRDLQRTGNSIVVISAGNGVFEVDKNLAGISYQRMVDNGIGSDVLSVGLPPLHIAPFFLYSTANKPRDLDDTTPNEQYYEIPHWMHLSFVDYESDEAVFVDHLCEVEDSKHNRHLITDQRDFVILANGFLVRSNNSSVSTSKPAQLQCFAPSDFIAHTNKPRVVSNQRNLIEGREFRDILEACRPRHARSIPSALKAIVKQRKSRQSVRAQGVCWEDNLEGLQGGLEEWGMLDPETIKKEDSAFLGRPAASAAGVRNPYEVLASPQKSVDCDDDGAMELASQASSIASILLSTSHERSPYRTHPSSPSGGLCQLQKSLSLRLGVTDGNDDSLLLSAMENDNLGFPIIDGKDGNSTDRLRTMMRSHDSNIWRDETTHAHMKSEHIHVSVASRQASCHNVKGRLAKEIPSNVEPAGGLGAALSLHGQPSGVFYSSIKDARSPVLNRTNSLVGISTSQASYRRMLEMGSQGLSPSLLPHVAQKMLELPKKRQDWLPPSHIPLESRFVKPQQYFARGRTVGTRNKTNPDTRHHSQNKQALQSSRSLSVSPPLSKSFGSPPKECTQRRHDDGVQNLTYLGPMVTSSRAKTTSRKKKVFNPFRQQDEEDVLALQSHNRRRWSHVFPLGEVEFKRHAGPNWKSLTAPAILPLSVDYFPTQEEIDRKFTFSSYNVTLSEFEHKNYASNKDLFVEMVRQRLTQDFQLVLEDRINVKQYRRETSHQSAQSLATNDDSTHETNRQFLSMGHRLHVITYDPSADLIEVYRYDDKDTQKNVSFDYRYQALCQETQSYGKTRQTFTKYTSQYNWNKVDNIICGDDDREMREGMRFKRVMFGIIPEAFHGDVGAEEGYVAKFRRFLDYLDKLRDVDESGASLDIKFVTSKDKQQQEETKRMESTPGVERNSMVRIYIQLKKGKRDNLEWMEVALDSTFDTSWSYRIMFNWLVASSGKVDTQVQLLQRRCMQFGLQLVPFPQITVSRNIYLNPFKAPAAFAVSTQVNILRLQYILEQLDYVHDGVFSTEVDALLECMEHNGLFCFKQLSQSPWFSAKVRTVTGQKPSTDAGKKCCPTMGKQLVHRSGTLFVRVLTDLNGLHILVVLGNYRYLSINKGEAVATAYQSAFCALTSAVAELNSTVSESDIKVFERSALLRCHIPVKGIQ